jgi:hypothetical protein
VSAEQFALQTMAYVGFALFGFTTCCLLAVGLALLAEQHTNRRWGLK